MTIDELRNFRNADPFRPFWMRLDDGRRFYVEAPYYIGFSPSKELVMVVSETKTAWFSPDRITDVNPGRERAQS